MAMHIFKHDRNCKHVILPYSEADVSIITQ